MIELSCESLSVRCIWLYVLIVSHTRFRVNPDSIVAQISKNSLIEAGAKSELSDCNWTRTHNHLVHKRTLNHLAKLAKWLSCVVSLYLYGAFDCIFLSCHVHRMIDQPLINGLIARNGSKDSKPLYLSLYFSISYLKPVIGWLLSRVLFRGFFA